MAWWLGQCGRPSGQAFDFEWLPQKDYGVIVSVIWQLLPSQTVVFGDALPMLTIDVIVIWFPVVGGLTMFGVAVQITLSPEAIVIELPSPADEELPEPPGPGAHAENAIVALLFGLTIAPKPSPETAVPPSLVTTTE